MFIFRLLVLYLCVSIFPLQIFAQHKNINFNKKSKKSAPSFIENKGQLHDNFGNIRDDIKYFYTAPGIKVFFKENGFSYEIFKIDGDSFKSEQDKIEYNGRKADASKKLINSNRVDIQLIGANSHTQIIVENQIREYLNFYKHNLPVGGLCGVKGYTKLTYKNPWPFIDIIFYTGNENVLKYDIVVHPGGNISNIKFLYEGAENITIEKGSLNLKVPLGSIVEQIPFSFTNSDLKEVKVDYNLHNNTVSFSGQYNQSKGLTIDPSFSWSTYYGGSSNDIGTGISQDSIGNIYVAGYTGSSSLIATTGAYQTTYASGEDAFVVKLDSAGNRVWSTYFGGSNIDGATDIVSDMAGNTYTTGYTLSSSGIASAGAYDTSFGGSVFEDAFILKLDDAGARKWSTYYGSYGFDYGWAIDCDHSGNVYITGQTTSINAIASSGSYQTSFGGLDDGFVVKFDSSGSRIWGTYFGGPEYDFGTGISCDKNGNVYVVGITESNSDIASQNGYDTTYNGLWDAFIVKFNKSGSRVWATYYGGVGEEYRHSIASDKEGNVYIAGYTNSNSDIATANAFDSSYGGMGDGYLLKLDSSGQRKWATYIGDTDYDYSSGIGCDSFGNIYFSGNTSSKSNIATNNSYQEKFGGNLDAFVCEFDSTGARIWASYFGGNDLDESYDLSSSVGGDVFLTGITESSSGIASKNSYDSSYNGNDDAFIVKFGGPFIDIGIDTLIDYTSRICANDSLKINVLIENLYVKLVGNIEIKAEFIGPDTLVGTKILTTGLPEETKDTLSIESWFSFTKSGVYQLKVYLKSRDRNAYNDTLITYLTVYPRVKPAFTFDNNCLNQNTLFKNNSKIDKGTITYKWSFGDGTMSTDINPKKKFLSGGNFSVKLVATSDFGCADSIIQVVKIDTISPDAPDILYASLSGNNNIELFFKSAIDNKIDKYLVYGSKDNVNFTLIDSIQSNGSAMYKWEHNKIDFTLDNWCFYILSKDDCGNFLSTSSDTHCIIQLSAIAGNTSSQLSWTKYEGFQIDKYIIERLSANNSWDKIDSVSNITTTYTDTNLHCGKWYYYRITAKSQTGTISHSDTVGVLPYDTIAPAEVNMLYATVKTDNETEVAFHTAADKDVIKYDIYASVNGGAYSKLATITKPFSAPVTYAHTGINTVNNRYCYKVYASDSCGNISQTTEEHCAVKLQATAGNNKAFLNWSSYKGFNAKMPYIVQRKNASLWDDIATTSDTLFTDSLLTCNVEQTYRILTTEDNGDEQQSFSNEIKVTPFDTAKPLSLAIRYVTVKDGIPYIQWSKSASADVRNYQVYRKNSSGIFVSIASLGDVDTFTDVNADANLGSYCYKVMAIDSCAKNESELSSAHCDIFLQTSIQGCEKAIYLNWNSYSGWNATGKIEIYRTANGSAESLLTTLNASATSYKDSSLDFHIQYCYRIKAIENGSNAESWSNQSCNQTYFIDTAHIYTASKMLTSAANGSTLIKWKNQSGKRYISHYKLYYSTSRNGSYSVLADNIPVSADSFLHTNINTRTGEHYYYLVNVDSCATESDPSSTHKPIDLEVEIGQLIHDLNWTKYEGFDVQHYYIQRYNGSSFQTIDTLSAADTFSRQFPAPCNYNIFYRIAAADKEGRTALSDTMGRTAIDTIFANAALINNITVTGNNTTELTFRGSDSLDVYAYTIQRSEDGVWGTAGQVLYSSPGDMHSFTDNINTQQKQLCYTIITLDSCLNATMSADTFCAIQLKGAELNLSNSLAWHGFKGYNTDKYAVLTYNGTDWDTLATTNGDTNHLHMPLPCNVPVSYRIAGIEKGGNRISLSDTIILTPFDTIDPVQPEIIYATVLDNEHIYVQWKKSIDSDVKLYELSYRSAGGEWKTEDTLEQTFDYTFSGLNTMDSTYSFRIRAIDSCAENTSIPSNIHTPVQLSGEPRNLANQLNWSLYEGLAAIEKYYIYIYNDCWKLLDSTDASTANYLHKPLSCNVAQWYKIRTVDTSGNISSWSDSLMLTPFDTIKPVQPVIQYANVLDGSNIHMQWQQSEPDVKKYELSIRTANADWQTGITVEDTLNYTFTGLTTLDSVYSFRIRATDSCNENTSIHSETHSTIQLQGEPKNLSNYLIWSAYEGFDVSKYYIYNYNNGWNLLDSTQNNVTEYTHTPLACNVAQYYRVGARDINDLYTTLSDSIQLMPFDTIKPEKPTLHYATVQPDRSIKLSWSYDNNSDVKYFEVWRSTNGGSFTNISTVVYDSIFTDVNISAQSNSYQYYVISIDSCNLSNRSTPSDTDRIMNLTLASGACLPEIRLNWTKYSDFTQVVDGYDIYRMAAGENSYTKIKTLSAVDTSYTDATVSQGTNYYYKIRALDNQSNYESYSDTSGLAPYQFPVPLSSTMVYASVRETGTTDGSISLSWEKYLLSDTFARGYNLYYRVNNGAYSLLHKTYDLGETAYIHHGINTSDNLHEYYIKVFNLCEIEGDSNIIFHPVNLEVENKNLEADISWHPFKGESVTKYELYRSRNNAAAVLVGTFTSSDTSYTDNNILCDNNYTYSLQAHLANNMISYSDTVNIKAFDTIPPAVPMLYYVSVETTDPTTGKVNMKWKGNSEKNRAGYRIYRSENGEPMNLHVILLATDTGDIYWEDVNLNTKDNYHSYAISAIDSCTGNESPKSATHRTIYLKAEAKSQYIQLYWHAYPVFNNYTFTVEKQEPNKPWIALDTLPSNITSYQDSNVTCHVFYNYRIRSANADSVIIFSLSNTAGDTAFETVVPDAPVVKGATVVITDNVNGRNLVEWQQSVSKDAAAYNLYRSENGMSWTPVVQNYTFLSYVDVSLNTSGKSYYYRIETVDSCGNISEPSTIHKTILLDAVAGNSENILSWTKYEGFEVKEYNIYRDGAKYFTAPGNVTSMTDTMVLCTIKYGYYVEAVSDEDMAIMSLSNIDSAQPYDTKAPRAPYLSTATVSLANREVTLQWDASTSFDARIYYISKRSGENGRISLLDSTNSLTYTEKVDTIKVSDCYFISAVDYCNNISTRSNRACLMILEGKSHAGSHTIKWNPYEVWQDGVQLYKIYKKEDVLNWREIGLSTAPEFTDDFLNDTITEHCYQVEAIENTGAHNATSFSTTICLNQEPVVYIPNAFTPGAGNISEGINDFFGPRGINMHNYKMQIFNRWGQIVYNTQNGKPWDGSYRGEQVLEGVYMYIITIEGHKNSEAQRLKGTVTVIK